MDAHSDESGSLRGASSRGDTSKGLANKRTNKELFIGGMYSFHQPSVILPSRHI